MKLRWNIDTDWEIVLVVILLVEFLPRLACFICEVNKTLRDMGKATYLGLKEYIRFLIPRRS